MGGGIGDIQIVPNLQQMSRFKYSYNRFDWLVGWLFCWFVGQFVGGLFGWLDGWLDGWSVGWLDGWLVGWLITWLGWEGRSTQLKRGSSNSKNIERKKENGPKK